MEANYEFPFIHKHKLKKFDHLNYPCCVCKSKDPDESCFICADNENECKEFSLCKCCAQCASEEEMKKLHNHLLVPTKRSFWKCDLCKKCIYKSGLSMCCLQCNFDVCVYCFYKLNKPRIIQ